MNCMTDIKEILVLHHSHFDIGYTHTQPVVMELQRDFIDQALILLDSTKDWDEFSQPRWTCEATTQVLKWLETASERDVARFEKYLKEGRIGISGMDFNITPLCSAEQLVRLLYKSDYLQRKFGIRIRTVNQHDINGVPWSLADILIDSGIELLIMAINLHFGGITVERPAVFRWQAPSGRELLVMNGAHYTMFDQLLYSYKKDLNEMRRGLAEYLEHLEEKNYDLDFIYLTTANAPVCWDNSPPNPEVAQLIREWNKHENTPPIRFITPEMLLQRIKEIPREKLKLYSGDWTDYWSFGVASTAVETKVNQHTKYRLRTAELLAAATEKHDSPRKNLYEKAWKYLNLYDEHTWGAFNSEDHDHPFVKSQAKLKDSFAYQAREITEYLIVDELEKLAGNSETAFTQDGVLVVNPSGVRRTELIPIPDWWRLEGKRLRTSRHSWTERYDRLKMAPLAGPITIEPYSWKKIRLDDLQSNDEPRRVQFGEKSKAGNSGIKIYCTDEDDVEKINYIESDWYNLEYDPCTGRIIRLIDKKNDWCIIDGSGDYTFFQFVQEFPDPLFKGDRKALYNRDMEKEKFDISCWNDEMTLVRRTAIKPRGNRIEENARGIELVLEFDVPGSEFLEQRILIANDSPVIELNLKLMKQDVRTPESVYFAFPLSLAKGWRCHFDTAGVPVELDVQQLPGSCRDWLAVNSFVALYDENHGAALYCPDAPIVQVGDFNFGSRSSSIQRKANPMLLAWSLNNYWDTNFRITQPGSIELRYYFRSFQKFDLFEVFQEASALCNPLEIHPAISCEKNEKGRFFEL
ncbi:hypothetical protein GF337_17135, partial [candidate division KSB1 bacterium]|nr:hypothetical protein [candidate division KSB1 bacterium]